MGLPRLVGHPACPLARPWPGERATDVVLERLRCQMLADWAQFEALAAALGGMQGPAPSNHPALARQARRGGHQERHAALPAGTAPRWSAHCSLTALPAPPLPADVDTALSQQQLLGEQGHPHQQLRPGTAPAYSGSDAQQQHLSSSAGSSPRRGYAHAPGAGEWGTAGPYSPPGRPTSGGFLRGLKQSSGCLTGLMQRSR